MNAKLAVLLASAGFGALAGTGFAVASGWGILAAMMLYSVGGSAGLLAASALVYLRDAAHPAVKAAHA